MKSLTALCLSILCMHHVNAAGLNLPLDPAEAAIILAIPVAEGVEVEAADLPGYAKKGLLKYSPPSVWTRPSSSPPA